jgi:hypothetical protein
MGVNSKLNIIKMIDEILETYEKKEAQTLE